MRGLSGLIVLLGLAAVAASAAADAPPPAGGASALLAEARETMPRDLSKSAELAEQARAAALAEGQRELQFDAESQLAQIGLQRSDVAAARPHVAAAEALFAEAGLASREAELWWLRGRLAVQERRTEDADGALQRALALAESNGDRHTMARSLHTRGQLMIRTGRQPEAETLLERSLEINSADGREHEADANRHYLGFIARDRGAYQRALELHLAVLTHADARHDTQGIAHSANALGIVYGLRQQMVESVAYFRRAIEAYNLLGDRYSAAMTLINVGDAHNIEGRFPEAKVALYEAKALVDALDNEDARILLLAELASCHVGLAELSIAEGYALEAVELSAKAVPVRRQQALDALAKVRFGQSRAAEAVTLWAQAVELSRKVSRKPDLAETLQSLAKAEAEAGDAAASYRHEHEAMELVTQSQKEELSQRLLEVAARYEAGKRDAELVAQKSRIADLEEAAVQHQRVRLLLAGGLLLAVLLVLSLQSRARAKAKVERVLREKNLIVEQANRDLAEAADADPLTGARNRRYFRRELAHRLEQRLRSPGDVALLLIDADHFKRINDRHGHAAGDAALQAIVAAWRAEAGADERVIRWGGEEFLVVLEGVDAGRVRESVARGLAAVRAAPRKDPALPPELSVSAGWFLGPCAGIRLDDALRLADLALLEAKRHGRDRAVGVLGESLSDSDPGTLDGLEALPAAAVVRV